MAANNPPKEQTPEQELAALQLKKVKLELENLEAQREYFNDQRVESTERREKTRLELAHMRLQQDQIRRTQRDRAKQLNDQEQRIRARILGCPHKKGGMDLAGYKAGDDSKYSVFRHQWPNGDFSIQCQRCSNIVIPPVEPLKLVLAPIDIETIELYGFTPETAGYFSPAQAKEYVAARKTFSLASRRYTEWLKMQTNNEASGSNQLKQISSSSQTFNFDRCYRLALHESLGIPNFQEQKWPMDPNEKPQEELAIAG